MRLPVVHAVTERTTMIVSSSSLTRSIQTSAWVLVTISGSLTGCTSSHTAVTPPTSVTSQAEPAAAGSQDARQTQHPTLGPLKWESLPKTLQIESMRLAPSSHSTTETLAAAISRLRLDTPQPATRSPIEFSPAVAGLYVRARLAMQDGFPADAVPLLLQAVQQEPGSATLREALIDAQSSSGKRLDSAASLEAAAQADFLTPRTTMLMGRKCLKDGDVDRGMKLLVRSLDLASRSSTLPDPVLETIALAELGNALIQHGTLRAGFEAFSQAFATPPQVPASSPHRAELYEVARNQQSLMLRAADAACAMAEPEKAFTLYSNLFARTRDGTTELPARLAAAGLLAGKPEGAIDVLFRSELEGRTQNDGILDTLRVLASTDTAGGALAAMVAARAKLVAAEFSRSDEQSIRARSIVIGCSMLLPAADARGPLLMLLEKNPRDPSALAILIDLNLPDRCPDIVRLLEAAPDACGIIAEQLVLSGRSTAHTIRELGSSPSIYGKLGAAAAFRELGKYESAETIVFQLDSQADPRLESLRLLERIKLDVARTGAADSTTVSTIVRLAEQNADPSIQRMFAQAYMATGNFSGAAGALRPLLQASDPSIDDLILAAQAVAVAGQHQLAETFLLKARAEDPTDDRATAGLLNLYGRTGPLADERKLSETIRSHRTTTPNSRLVRTVSIQDSLARGLAAQARTSIRTLVGPADSRPAPDPYLIELLVQTTAVAGTDEETRTGVWTDIESLYTARPESPTLIAARLRLLLSRNQRQDAAAFASRAVETAPTDPVLAAAELVYRSTREEADLKTADTILLRRLNTGLRSVSRDLEYIQVATRLNLFTDASLRAKGMKVSVPLSDAERQSLAKLLEFILAIPDSSASGSWLERDSTPISMPADRLSLFDLLTARDKDVAQRAAIPRLRLVAAATSDDLEGLYRECERASEVAAGSNDRGSVQARASATMLAAVGQCLPPLMARSDPSLGLRFLGLATNRIQPSNSVLMNEWIRLTAVKGDDADVNALLAEATNRELLEAVFAAGSDGTVIDPTDDTQRRAELLYLLGNAAAGADRTAFANALYRRTLEVLPTHGWAANNLGYTLLEEGNLIEATPLIEQAAKSLPDQYNIIDSLAWVRYHQGILSDEKNPDGTVSRRGALTLIDEAIATAGPGNDALLEHRGDIAWRIGRKEEAADAWRSARQVVIEELSVIDRIREQKTQIDVPPGYEKRLRASRERLDRKITAADTGNEPPLTKQLGVP